MIDNLSAEVVNQNYDAVSILGFDVSRRWFPLAMFIILVIIYSMLYETLKQAKNKNCKIISGYNSDTSLDFLVDKKWIRFTLWIISPVLLMFFTLYSTLIRYDYFIYGLIGLSSIACFILGWLAYKISLQL